MLIAHVIFLYERGHTDIQHMQLVTLFNASSSATLVGINTVSLPCLKRNRLFANYTSDRLCSKTNRKQNSILL